MKKYVEVEMKCERCGAKFKASKKDVKTNTATFKEPEQYRKWVAFSDTDGKYIDRERLADVMRKIEYVPCPLCDFHNITKKMERI